MSGAVLVGFASNMKQENLLVCGGEGLWKFGFCLVTSTVILVNHKHWGEYSNLCNCVSLLGATTFPSV